MPVTIDCPRCRRTIDVTHDALRSANDNGTPPPCIWCDTKSMVMSHKGSAADLIAAAVLRLQEWHVRAAELSEIIVASWFDNRERFGLRGFKNLHPDSNRVSAEVSKMLRKIGKRPPLLSKVGKRQYALTAYGRERAAFVSETKGANQ